MELYGFYNNKKIVVVHGLKNGEIKRIINDEAHCIPRECNDNEYYELSTRNCQLCPDDKIIENDSGPKAFPLIEDCEYTEEQIKELNIDTTEVTEDYSDNNQLTSELKDKIAQIENNRKNIDVNGEFSRMLDGMEEIKKQLIQISSQLLL